MTEKKPDLGIHSRASPPGAGVGGTGTPQNATHSPGTALTWHFGGGGGDRAGGLGAGLGLGGQSLGLGRLERGLGMLGKDMDLGLRGLDMSWTWVWTWFGSWTPSTFGDRKRVGTAEGAPNICLPFPKERGRTGPPSPWGHTGLGGGGWEANPQRQPPVIAGGTTASLTPSPCWGVSSGEGTPLLPTPSPAGRRDRGGAQGSEPPHTRPPPRICPPHIYVPRAELGTSINAYSTNAHINAQA